MCWRRRIRRGRWRRRPSDRIARGAAGPLEGLPLGIKDLFATEGVRTTACSKILGEFLPPYESTVSSQLWRDGAVHARQVEQRRIRDGLVERDLVLRPGGQSVAARRFRRKAGAGRFLRRLGLRRCRGAALPGRHRDRHRRLDPPAGGLHRAPSASSRPMAAARAGASSRSRPRSTRPARSRAPCAMPRS